MKNYKEQLKQLFNNPNYTPVSTLQLGDIFEVESNEQLKSLEAACNTLQQEGVVYLSKKNRWLSCDQQNVLKGIIRLNQRNNGYVEVTGESEDIFVASTNLNFAMNKDVVLVKVHDTHPKVGEVVAILERSTTHLVGEVNLVNKRWEFIPSLQSGLKVQLKWNANFKLVNGLIVKTKILSYQDPMIVEIQEIIGHKNSPTVDVLAIYHQLNIPVEFSKEALDQAQSVNEEVIKSKDRVDFTDYPVITIDGADAKDLDDAIYIKKHNQGYTLHVHIADVSYYVPQFSPIDNQAKERGTSVYAADSVVPMLPVELSNGICSLHPHVNRYTISVLMEVDFYGHVHEAKIVPSIINSSYRFTYDQVNAIFSNDKKAMVDHATYVEMLMEGLECAHLLRKVKHDKGSIGFETKESKFIFDKNHKIKEIIPIKQGEAEKMIEDFMVAANENVAHQMKVLEYPCIYRVHEKPDADKIRSFAKIAHLFNVKVKGHANNIHPKQIQSILESIQDPEIYPVVSMLLLRSMQKAVYDVNPLGHFGLALEDYVHFTSPIRRYPDLIVHRMIRKYLFESTLDQKELQADLINNMVLARESSLYERRAVDAERAVEDLKKAEYMQAYIGKQFEGIISGVTSFGFFVQLANTIEGLVHVQTLNDDYYEYQAATFTLIGVSRKNTFRLGDKVIVKVKVANKEKRVIDFTYVKHVKKRK